MKKTLLFSTALIGGLSVAGQATKEPNIVLILSDDQGWGATSVQMDNLVMQSASDFMRTPNLERLAASGMRFANGYTCHANSSPSRASILTGKTPARLHLTDIIERGGGSTDPQYKLITPLNLPNLASSQVTIGEMIKQYKPNYATAYFGKWHLGGVGPQGQGFDASDGITNNDNGNRKLVNDPKDIFGVASRSMAWMTTQVQAQKPFFIEIAHYACHEATEDLPATYQKYAGYTPGTRHNNISYAAMTEDLDTGVGMVLDKINELGIQDNTYIVYLADNGAIPGLNPSNTNGPIRGNKATVWEGGIRTPFIVAGPGIEANKVSRVRVVGWDLFPTFCDLLGITQLPDSLDGGSILPVLKNGGVGKVQRPNDFMVWHWPCYVVEKGGYPSTAIIKDSLKYIYSYETGVELLFNIEKDIAETTPLNTVYPAKLAELKSLMNGYLTSVKAGLPRSNPNYSGIATETPASLVLHLPFDGNLDDESTNQMTVTGKNNPTFATGKYGEAVVLNGTSQWLDVSSALYLNPDVSKTKFTICSWVYNTNQHTDPNSIILTQCDGSGTGRILLDKMRQTGGSGLSTFLGGTRNNATSLSFVDNQWIHVAAVGDYATKSITFYINGEQTGNVVTTNPFETCIGNYRIGGHKDGTKAYWSGMLDEFYFFTRALSKDEINKVMNNEWVEPTGLKKNTVISNVFIYPNPARNTLNIVGVENITTISLISIDGRLLVKKNNAQSLDVHNLSAGQYFLKIETKEGNPIYKKVIIG